MSGSFASRRDLLALTLAAASWGLGTVISKRALEEIPPLTLLPIQLSASLLVLATLMRGRGMSLRGSPAVLARLGILNPGLLYLTALRNVPASMAAVSFYLIPLFGVAGGFLLLGERLDPRQWVGAVIVLSAVLLIIRRPARDPGYESAIGVVPRA